MVMETTSRELPLFPLQTVYFPGSLLALKVFESRYLDMVSTCMRSGTPFGVIGLATGTETKSAEGVSLRPVGTFAELIDVDATQPGILELRCAGRQRFRLVSSRQQADGLWLGTVEPLPDDEVTAPGPMFENAVDTLRRAIESIEAQGAKPFLAPYRFDDAGWVANRWCEMLPIDLDGKQMLMEMTNPLERLGLIDSVLRQNAVSISS